MSILRQGENDLETTNPDFLSEWDFDANFEDGGLIPANISTYSSRKVHWICPKGHHYMMSPVDKMRGCGCNICDGKVVLKGYNDLESQYPEIAKTWDYGRNGDLKPDQVTWGSNRRVWWICEKGHHWIASVKVRRNTGCSVCSHKMIQTDLNDFATLHPDLLSEWDFEKNNKIGIDPHNIASSSHTKAWWICPKGHSYQSSISSRAFEGSKCPICQHTLIVSHINDLKTLYPEILKYWDYERNNKLGIQPDSIAVTSNKKVWWTCKNGHHWMASISNRVSLHSSCPYCSKHISREQVAIRILIERMGYEAYDSEKIEGIEYDILCKPLKLVIEYHGSYFHEDHITDKDKNKDNVAKNNQYKFIIIREVVSDNPSDPFLYNDNGIVTIDYEMKPCNYDKFYSLLEFIQKIIIEKYPDKEFKEANCVDIYKEACKYMMSNPSGKKMHYEPINII